MELSIKEKIGQRFIFGVNSDNIDCIIELIKNAYIGGVILYKRNYQSYSQMLSVIKKLKEANKDNKIPLFIAIDQEGGKVNRLPKEFHLIKNIYDISRTNEDLVKNNANVIGRILSETGINMNFAPVLDVYNGSKSKALYKRCFYGESKEVSKHGNIYIKELDNNRVIPVVKHYPGHGASKLDSHFFIPYIFNYKDVLNEHMKPFESVIKEGIPAVMVGHLVVRKLTRGLPASVSNKFINECLRERNGFNGLIITDEINMLKHNILYRFIYLNRLFRSNSDIILVKIKDYKDGYAIISKYEKILARDGNYNNLDDSVKRIVSTKDKYKINDDINFDGCNIEEINKEIDDINGKVISY